jgi:cyclopropane-fatty-acyl-phospholipid synthase
VGELRHQRLGEVEHAFRYPMFVAAIDLDELPALAAMAPWVGHERVALLGLSARDHFDGVGTLREQFDRTCAGHGVTTPITRVQLVTQLRFAGILFNPVSYWYGFDAQGALKVVIAEVNNTFGERHPYVLTDLTSTPQGWRAAAPKSFFVSPFYDVQGEYEFDISRLEGTLALGITVRRGGDVAFRAMLTGQARPLTRGAIARTLVQQPLSAALTVPRILLQAARLHWQKKLPIVPKPAPTDRATTRVAGATAFQRVAARLVLRALGGIREHHLVLTLPDGREVVMGDATRTPLRMHVRDPECFVRLVTAGDIGLGEAFEHGEWDSPEPTEVLLMLARERAAIERAAGPLARLSRPIERLQHALRRNSLTGSRRNIRKHYDLGNEFFELFLDPSMTYSSGRFTQPQFTLEQSQDAKLDAALWRSGVGAGAHVAEIGCGWGSFALKAARAGVRVTGVTLSQQQHALATQRLADAGLAPRTEILLRDYRVLQGTYDAIVSIEMLEAVGHRGLGEFFAACERLVKPGGHVVIQVITIADQKYAEYMRRPDWIQKYIFPGGHLPSIGAMTEAMRRHSSFVITQLEGFGMDYARTLVEWRTRFEQRREDALALGLDEAFLRRWAYYFHYCEAGFRTGEIDVVQMVLRRPVTAPPAA